MTLRRLSFLRILFGLVSFQNVLFTSSSFAVAADSSIAFTQPQNYFEHFDDAASVSLLAHDDHHGTVDFMRGGQDGRAPVDFEEDGQYEVDFIQLDRSIIGRQDSNNDALTNNNPATGNLTSDNYNDYTFSIGDGSSRKRNVHSGTNYPNGQEHDLELDKRADQQTVYISITTCQQPTIERNNPQLLMFLSNSSQNPRLNTPATEQVQIINGYANKNISTTGDLYISVYGQPVDVSSGSWSYEIAASTDQYYHSYASSAVGLALLDSDSSAALLITKTISDATPNNTNTSVWLASGPPLSVLVYANASSSAVAGMTHSYCGLTNYANISSLNPNNSISTSLVSYVNNPTQQQWYIPNLANSTNYTAVVVQASNAGQPGGGGAVYATTTFTTKTFANCRLLYNLSFCSDVAWAVPANPALDFSNLSITYDKQVQNNYVGFNYSLQQIPCNTTSTAQYSLNKTCDDCAAAYKSWLCAVSIPRCADWASYSDAFDDGTVYLMPRNAAQKPLISTPGIPLVTNETLLSWNGTNQSRNGIIDTLITPGPYREVLPCADLCYELVRACPAVLGFGCPLAGKGLESSYGRHGDSDAGSGGLPKCNLPGAVWANGAGQVCVWAKPVVVAWAVIVTVMAATGV